MTASRVQEDEPESDDQGQQFNTPLIQKPVLMIDGLDSANTLMTSPCSSLSRNNESTLVFNDYIKTVEVDCTYTDEEITQLWFTKTEYDDFLQSCDEDAQKCEAREKELRVAKLKKEIRKQRRQRRKEEKRRQILDHSSSPENDLMDDDMDDDIADDSLEGENPKGDASNNDDEEPICSLGLEAWTLEGYQTREHHRQKAMDAVLNEQYAAWDRGLVENTEMMSALYFAASATSKHSATKRGKQLEEDIKEFMVVSTLEDYNRAVQTLNVLQKSLYCIKSKNQRLRPKANRRGSNENTNKNDAKMNRRGSNENTNKNDAKMNRRGSNESTKSSSKTNYSSSSVDRTMAVMDAANDKAPQPPMNALSDGSLALKSNESCPPPTASSTTARNGKKIKQRGSKISGTPHKVYKSKASMNIIVAPPTPPTVKARRVSQKPSVSVPDLMVEDATPSTKKSPKSRKVAYKPAAETSSKAEESSKSIKNSKSSKSTKSTETRPKLKGKSRRRSISPGTVPVNKDRSNSPKREGARSKSRRKLEGERSRSKSRSKSPKVERERSRSKSRSKSPKDTPENTPKEHRSRKKSPGRFADKISTKSPRPSARKLLQKMNPNKEDKHAPDLGSCSTTENASSLSTHGSIQGNNNTKKDQHWWFSQTRQEVQ